MDKRVLCAGLLFSLIDTGCTVNRIFSDDSDGGACDPSSDPGCSGDMGDTWMPGGGPPPPTGTCSADLQNIVDSNGNIIKMCPPDQGCAGGVCVPACTAAAMSTGSIGCDFYAPDSPFYANGQGTSYNGPCYAVFVANTWSRPAQITVTRAGQTFDVTQFGHIPSGIIPNITYSPIPATGVPPNQVAILFLSEKSGAMFGCPATPAILNDEAVSGSGQGSAFHVVSDTPITAYDILPYGGAASYLPAASLLFPSTAWGSNYYVVAPHTDGGGELWMLIVGSADNTKVTISPKVTLPGGGSVPSAPQGMLTNFTLNTGDVLQWVGADPTSTVLQSTAPIGVFTGSTYLRVATNTSPMGGGEDCAHQQIPQIKALGSEYVGPSIMTRLSSMQPESVPYRLLGVVDGTTLSYDPPTAPPGAPSSLNAGQVVEFETTSLFAVKSQDDNHPFGLTQYMPGAPTGNSRSGCTSGGSGCALGDEDWVNVLAPKQFLQNYVFFTDPTYGTTNLVITRVAGTGGFSDVTIDCLAAPVSGWQKVDNAGKYQVAYVDLVRGGSPLGTCNGSRHQATSKGQFGITVWGTDYYASYGYSAGGNVGSINSVSVPPIP